jgi:glutaminyl-tRNA synthetase
MSTDETTPVEKPRNFIHEIIEEHNRTGRFGGRVHTRFPPEPNGYLHLGHAKSICLNFGTALKYGGKCNLRFDDTNPTKEDVEYVNSIMEDVRWLGFEWGGVYYASDYFEQLYQWAELLIQKGLAYVDSSTLEEIRQNRGTVTQPGTPGKFRDRPSEESLDLFRRMRAGEFADGAHVLRAKIDLAHPNMLMRDPILYRIRHAHHHRTGDDWCIYPMYDFAHGYSDSIEGITHSICTLEFEVHRVLYDWLIDSVGDIHHPQQIEFARLNLTYTMMSKRKLLELVESQTVAGWDDPRMPTIAGIRRRGYPPSAIRAFCDDIGVTRFNGMTDLVVLENAIRNDLNRTAPRYMAVLKPLKVVITNYPEGQSETLDAVNNPEDPSAGTRQIPFGRELFIEQDDFLEDPPKKFFRLAPGREVRLRWGYFITCQEVVKDASGQIVELRCTYDPATRGGNSPDGRKVKATIHWVSAADAIPAEVRLYETLFTVPDLAEIPEDADWRSYLNPNSLTVNTDAKLEPALANLAVGDRCQFERLGYFCVDQDSKPGHPVFNRTVTLKDTWAKEQKKGD